MQWAGPRLPAPADCGHCGERWRRHVSYLAQLIARGTAHNASQPDMFTSPVLRSCSPVQCPGLTDSRGLTPTRRPRTHAHHQVPACGCAAEESLRKLQAQAHGSPGNRGVFHSAPITVNLMHRLPEELQYHVLTCCATRSVGRLRCTSKALHALGGRDTVWIPRITRHFQHCGRALTSGPAFQQAREAAMSYKCSDCSNADARRSTYTLSASYAQLRHVRRNLEQTWRLTGAQLHAFLDPDGKRPIGDSSICLLWPTRHGARYWAHSSDDRLRAISEVCACIRGESSLHGWTTTLLLALPCDSHTGVDDHSALEHVDCECGFTLAFDEWNRLDGWLLSLAASIAELAPSLPPPPSQVRGLGTRALLQLSIRRSVFATKMATIGECAFVFVLSKHAAHGTGSDGATRWLRASASPAAHVDVIHVASGQRWNTVDLRFEIVS